MSWRPTLPHWRHLPLLQWGRGYGLQALIQDAGAGLIVAILVIPQSLAYALLAGLPAEVGLYASVAPLLLYALLGSSRVQAVGPVAVVSLMTGGAIGELSRAGLGDPVMLALTLAGLSGLMLVVMGWLRMGFLASFLSHPVSSAFVTASGILIAAGQVRVLIGLQGGGHTLPEILVALWTHARDMHALTAAVGLGSLAFLYWARRSMRGFLVRCGVPAQHADLPTRLAPLMAVMATTAISSALGGSSTGMKTVGLIPEGLPPLSHPSWSWALWQELALPALLISVVGFVSSVSVAQTFAAKRRERIDPDQELVALGAANLAAAFTGGLPVTGGFSRTVVNVEAGAKTPAAGLFTAAGILLITLLFTPALAQLPQATLAATITVAVLSLVDFQTMRHTWAYSKADFIAWLITLTATLALGFEMGLILGVGASLVMVLYRTSLPHIATVGLVPGTEHFRNVDRHEVITRAELLSLRVDESLYFANARSLEDRINQEVARQPALRHVVLQCSAINDIDASALESLQAINRRLREAGIQLHLSEVKGPVMDRLKRSPLLTDLSGQVFLSHFQAFQTLSPDDALANHSHLR